ncbi:MAG: hypothetical protein Q9P14_15110, partial [candidate division KSB1 bacterium]|nr:hypothetical protein [candidate division KSB1 bacterium]
MTAASDGGEASASAGQSVMGAAPSIASATCFSAAPGEPSYRTHSSNELLASRLAPCTPVQATSPTMNERRASAFLWCQR